MHLRLTCMAATAVMAGANAHAQSIPGLENYSLPASRPTGVPTPVAPVIALPTPTPTPTPTLTPTPIPTPTPAPRPTPARAAPITPPAPAPSATLAPQLIEPALPTPTPTPSVAQPPIAPTTTPPPPSQTEPADYRLLAASAAAILAAGVALVWWRRRRRPDAAAVLADNPVPPPAAPPEPIAPAHPPITIEPPITLELRPTRAGLNMISATVEAELVVTNADTIPATGIHIMLGLLSAGAMQDSDLGAFNTQPIARPALPPFTLEAGATRSARIVVALPRDSIQPMMASGRPMFVPLVAAIARFTIGGHPVATTQSFAVGVTRDGTEKLAPFWLDAPAAVHGRVAARANAAAVIA